MKFILSVDDDRYNGFMNRFHEAFEGPTEIQRIGYTPDNLPVPVPKWWGTQPARWALVQGDLFALNTAYDAGEDCELYEDDCIFCKNFLERRNEFLSALPDDWDMAFQGGQLLGLKYYPLLEVPGNDKVLHSRSVHRNHAWICRHDSIPKVLDWYNQPDWFNRHTWDWRMVYLHTHKDFKAYIPKDGWLCGQGAGTSSLNGKTYPDRWWHYTQPEAEEEIKRWAAFNEEAKRSTK